MVSSVLQWVKYKTQRGKPTFMSSRPGTGNGGTEHHRPYWLTFEYYVYLIPLLTVVYIYTKATMQLAAVHMVDFKFKGQPAKIMVYLFDAYFSDGVLDFQWFNYDNAMKVLIPVFLIMALCVNMTRRLTSKFERRLVKTVASSGSKLSRCLRRMVHAPHPVILLHCLFGVLFVAVVHGPYVVVLFLLIAVNYLLATQLQHRMPYQVYMAVIWGFNVFALHMSTYSSGFSKVRWLRILLTGPPSWEHYRALFDPLVGPAHASSASSDAQAYMRAPLLWRQRMRWQLAYGLVMLRLVAFDYDLWEAHHEAAKSRARATEKHSETCVDCAVLRDRNAHATAEGEVGQPCASWCYKLRTEYPRDTEEYNFITYLAYILFPPLYLAGPISSYNAYVSHLVTPSTAMRLRDMIVYIIRIAFIYACELVLLHFIFVNSFLAVPGLMMQLSIVERACLLYLYLAHLWLKFNFIWKTSRLFAFWVGVEAPEDMRNCFSSVTSIQGFWRDWHASFNLWIVRYMYIPMGGNQRKFLSIFPIFLFIAFWHDRELRLLYWAMCVCVAFAIELVVQGLFAKLERAVRAQMRQPFDQSSQSDLSQALERHSCVACLAHFITHRLSAGQRAFGYRVLCSLGSTMAAFSLIVANLIGFCVHSYSLRQNNVTVRKSELVDKLIINTLKGKNVFFIPSMFILIFLESSISTMRAEYIVTKHKRLRIYYGLRSTAA